MDDFFKIFVEQLRDGHTESITESFDPAFMDVEERELSFQDKVDFKGSAYLADDTLVIKFDASTKATLLCAVCNQPVKVDITVNDFYSAIPLDEIKGAIYNFKDLLRETILLEIPTFAECEGNCPRRKEIAKYLKKPPATENSKDTDNDGYQPFADFDWDKSKNVKQ